jgi:hypothetical protein
MYNGTYQSKETEQSDAQQDLFDLFHLGGLTDDSGRMEFNTGFAILLVNASISA